MPDNPVASRLLSRNKYGSLSVTTTPNLYQLDPR